MINELACAIIERAVEDYKLLVEYDIEEIHYNDGSHIFKSELEQFFLSEWCDFLLGEIQLTGEAILRHLKK